MPIKSIIVKKSNHEHDIIWKEVDDLVDIGLAMELEEEEEKKEKYKQLEFDFEDDQVAPI